MGVVVARQVTGYRESRPASPTAASAASGHAALPTRRHPAQHAVDGRAHGVVINGCGHQRVWPSKGQGEQVPRLGSVIDVRFTPGATKLLLSSEMTRCAKRRHNAVQ